jgi:ketosteroid isomerase-like protein
MTGKNEVRSHFAKVFEMPGFSLTWTPDRIDVSAAGDMGYAFGTYKVSYQDSSSLLVEKTRYYATVWKKQSSGNWEVVLGGLLISTNKGGYYDIRYEQRESVCFPSIIFDKQHGRDDRISDRDN